MIEDWSSGEWLPGGASECGEEGMQTKAHESAYQFRGYCSGLIISTARVGTAMALLDRPGLPESWPENICHIRVIGVLIPVCRGRMPAGAELRNCLVLSDRGVDPLQRILGIRAADRLVAS